MKEIKLKQIYKNNPTLFKLLKRADFLLISKEMSAGVTGLVLQARKRDLNENLPERIIRVGYTCSKKVGNAVVRNRSKRRLREIGLKLLSIYGVPGWDYVLIARYKDTVNIPFNKLEENFIVAINKIHKYKFQGLK